MSRKAKASIPKKKKPRNGILTPVYNSLAEGPLPAERLTKLLREARGVKPMTENELDQLIEANRSVWPEESEIDEFISWLHNARREGRYR